MKPHDHSVLTRNLIKPKMSFRATPPIGGHSLRSVGMTLTVLSFFSTIAFSSENHIRPAAIAGKFYPADKTELTQLIDGYLDKAPTPPIGTLPGRIKILILPHAGYIYSGQTAAFGYRLIERTPYDSVILIGPCHSAAFRGASIWRSGDWQTPLGTVPVDETLARAIASESPEFQADPNVHRKEHSLEAQLPFLQKTLTNFKIVPILTDDASPENCLRLAQAIFKNIKGKNVLVVVSTDMSHYYQDSSARLMDLRTLELLKTQDFPGLSSALKAGSSEFCGQAAVLTALEISRLMGDTHLKILNYATSADSTGDKSNVVGYGASVIYQLTGRRPVPTGRRPVSKTSGKGKLLSIARQTVESYATNGTIFQPDLSDPLLKENKAVFVTIRKNGVLRGCIGDLIARETLGLAVRDMAIQAASRDPRFKPVKKDELKDLTFEISVLSAPVKIKNTEEIKLGRDGVILSQNGHSGVFLPKVAEELAFDKERFLNELCTQKAGLSERCWENPATEIAVFTTEEFVESR